MDIRLLVLRTSDIKKLADFYSLFGLTFDYHKHGNSPFHYSATIGQTVLEIYPLTKSQTEADKNLRLGFGINNFGPNNFHFKRITSSVFIRADTNRLWFYDNHYGPRRPKN